jgi:predicted nucleotidyltransferase component of viral defense system
MEHNMKLHNNSKLFSDIIRAASDNLKINPIFIEKDYWITLVLYKLAESKYSQITVFKGGTSLSKGFDLINRFSEDVDIAIIKNEDQSGNTIKNLIRDVEKNITVELNEEILKGVTSKGSKFRKSVFNYKSIIPGNLSNRIIVEINSFANPFPYQLCTIKSFLYEFLIKTNNNNYIDQYELYPFEINILTKEQTMLEKISSLIRFSFSEDPISAIKSKIRHFYDIHFLLNDKDISKFINTEEFVNKLSQIWEHDKLIFDEPVNLNTKELIDSPIIVGFESIWNQVKDVYSTELTAFAFDIIPNEKEISKSFIRVIAKLNP